MNLGLFGLKLHFSRAFAAAMAAMPREVKVKTLEGGVVTVEVMPTNTIKECFMNRSIVKIPLSDKSS